MNIGIIGCSDIAFKRFMPAVKSIENANVVAVAEEYDTRRLKQFYDVFKIEGTESFDELISREDIDAVYIPQPPSLHYKWAKEALIRGKHVLLEKPSTVRHELSSELVDIARKNRLALHENYMFCYHSQIGQIKEIIANHEIGNPRLYKASFGFPLRKKGDFRYVNDMGGGALLDAGGYTVKLATILLGKDVKVDAARLCMINGYEVDMYGSAQLSNTSGGICQVSFGMDCFYQCKLEVWGSKGYLTADRVFTAPPDYTPSIMITDGEDKRIIKLEADNHFMHSIEAFIKETSDKKSREEMYEQIVLQASLIDRIREVSV